MEDSTAILGAIIVIAVIIGLIKGAIKTFQRNWIAALLLLILLTPIWIIWAFFELFTGKINESAVISPSPSSNNQSVNITLVNQADGKFNSLGNIQGADEDLKVIDAQVLRAEPSIVAQNHTPSTDDTKECQYCAETIKKNAIICRYCNKDI